MAERPVIVVIDDELAALAAMLDALTRRFGGDYRVVPHLSALAALDAVSKIKEDGEEIALVIADQWMPEMTGNEFLGRVRSIEPMAKRALLVAWGDHAAAPTILQGCALGQLDNYLYKPWMPAEVHLYPLVSEFLAEWTRIHRPAMELIHIVGDERSARSNEIRELLDRNGIPYGFHHATSPMAKRLIEEHGVDLVGIAGHLSSSTDRPSPVRRTRRSWTPSVRARTSCPATWRWSAADPPASRRRFTPDRRGCEPWSSSGT